NQPALESSWVKSCRTNRRFLYLRRRTTIGNSVSRCENNRLTADFVNLVGLRRHAQAEPLHRGLRPERSLHATADVHWRYSQAVWRIDLGKKKTALGRRSNAQFRTAKREVH